MATTLLESIDIAADPAGVALLLAGPSAQELLSDPTAMGGAGTAVEITAPRRTGVGFVAAAAVLSGDRCIARGSVSVAPATGGGTEVAVTLLPASDVNLAGLRHWLRMSLNEFGYAARVRSTAA